MSLPRILLSLLALSSALAPCSSFAPRIAPPRRTSCPRDDVAIVARRASSRRGDDDVIDVDFLERTGKFVISAFVALSLTFSSPHDATFLPTIEPANAASTLAPPLLPSSPSAISISSSVLISRGGSTVSPPEDEVVIRELEAETREVKKEARIDEKKARIEKSREAFFEYEARMAEEQESRIEAAEFRAEAEYSYDKEQAELLRALEKKAEGEMKMASTPKERAAKIREARVSFFRPTMGSLRMGREGSVPMMSTTEFSNRVLVGANAPLVIFVQLHSIYSA